MNNPSIPMASVEIAGNARFTALASDIGWEVGFRPDHVELGNGNSLKLVEVTDFGGVHSLKYSQPGACLYLTVIGA